MASTVISWYDWHGSVRVYVYYDDVAKVWVSSCPSMNLFSQGIEKEMATRAIYEAVELHMQHADRIFLEKHT